MQRQASVYRTSPARDLVLNKAGHSKHSNYETLIKKQKLHRQTGTDRHTETHICMHIHTHTPEQQFML